MSEENDVHEAVEETSTSETPQPRAPGVEELQQQLEQLYEKIEEQRDQQLRLQAELENGRRRAARDVENAHKYALEKFAVELLPVCDSLELALEAIGNDGHVEKLREGTELTLKMLVSTMEKFAIREVYPLHQPFNPDLHQAMSMQESAEHGANTVLHVMQKGYTLNDRLIRPALVIVAKTPAG